MAAPRKTKPAVRPRARRKALAPGKSREALLRQQLAEARAQQATTARILKVIARSPSDEVGPGRMSAGSTGLRCPTSIN